MQLCPSSNGCGVHGSSTCSITHLLSEAGIQVLEAKALQEDVPDQAADLTKPDIADLNARAGHSILDFRVRLSA